MFSFSKSESGHRLALYVDGMDGNPIPHHLYYYLYVHSVSKEEERGASILPRKRRLCKNIKGKSCKQEIAQLLPFYASMNK